MSTYDRLETLTVRIITHLSDGQPHALTDLTEQLQCPISLLMSCFELMRQWGLDVVLRDEQCYLDHPLQLLNETMIQQGVGMGRVTVMPVINSTNQHMLQQIQNVNSGDAYLAEYQQAGRGREGRQWFSPFGSSLSLSLCWKMSCELSAVMGMSLAVGITVAERLQQLGVAGVKVKWPNDIYLNRSKLAGILVESSRSLDGTIQLVVGIGMNLSMSTSMGSNITQRWCSLQQAGVDIERNQLAIELITSLQRGLERFTQHGLAVFVPQWRQWDLFYNRPVKLLSGNETLYGIARGIDTEGALLVEQDRQLTRFISGDISLRGVD